MSVDIEKLRQDCSSGQCLDFFQIEELVCKIDKVSNENYHEALECLINFSKTQTSAWYFLSSPEILSKTYFHIYERLSEQEIVSSWSKFPQKWRQIYLKNVKDMIEKHPNLTSFFFDEAIKDYDNTDEDSKSSAACTISNILSSAKKQLAYSLLEKGLEKSQELRISLIETFEKLYYLNPSLATLIEEKIWSFKPQNPKEYTILFRNLAAFIDIDFEKIDRCLTVINQHISDQNMDASSLNAAYHTLGLIRKFKTDKSEVDRIFLKGLQSPANNNLSRKNAYRHMGRIEELYSQATLGQRIEKSTDNEFGWRPIDQISETETCVLYLGGNGTETDKQANGYLKAVEDLMIRNNLKDKVALYAAVYDFGAFEDKEFVFDDEIARRKLMEDYKRGVRKSRETSKIEWVEQRYRQAKRMEDNIHPRYVKQIFDHAVLPRLVDKNGQKLPFGEAALRIRKLNIAAHCHGAYTFIKLEELMQQKMTELGYKSQEKADIQREFLCIALNPDAPLGVSKSTMISFCSAWDDETHHRNNFQNQVQHLALNNQLPFSYFPERQGNVFICSHLSENPQLINEHNFIGYNNKQNGLTNDGKSLILLEGNALISGVKNSLEGGRLPDIQTLVCAEDPKVVALFKMAKENGAKVWNRMTQSLRSKKMFILE